jgi:hypothetical protein
VQPHARQEISRPRQARQLRQRMIDDMTARRFSEDTLRDYAVFLSRSPDKCIFPLPMCKRKKDIRLPGEH